MKLVRLEKRYEKQLGDMIEEWKNDFGKGTLNHSPWAIFKNDYRDFDNYLQNLDYNETTKDHVKSSTFFLYDEKRDIFVGAANIRHELNEDLILTGGHIGDGIRPSERKKGYATLLVKLALEECKKIGISDVLMCCDTNNIGSKKSIINNGGKLENIVPEDDSFCERYWIKLK